MGPSATLRLQELVLERDRSRILQESTGSGNPFLADSQYTPFLLYNNPRIPNNNLAALGLGPSSVNELTRSAIALRNAGADIVALGCTTAYSWQDQVSERAGIPILNLLDLVARKVKCHGHDNVGLLDVDGTHARGDFRKALESEGLQVVLPNAEEQESIMDAVAKLKAGVKPKNGPCGHLVKVCRQLANRDCVTAIILGCTEIATALGRNIVVDDLPKNVEFFDTLDILAEAITRPSRNELNSAFQHNKVVLTEEIHPQAVAM